MPMKKAIENAKALIKHLEENPADLEKLNKADVKGVHKPMFGGQQSGQSAAGWNTRRAGEHKALPEPFRQGKADKAIGRAKEGHKQVIAEQKAMPKPNLPKAEMQKGDYFRERLGKAGPRQWKQENQVAAAQGPQKGVHEPMGGHDSGTSHTGFKVALKQLDQTSDSRASNSKPFQASMLSEAIGGHKKVIAQQAAMPKPNLPKAEMQKGAKDCCKEEWAPKFHKPAKSAGELVKEDWQPKFHQKGVHNASAAMSNKGGTSIAGNLLSHGNKTMAIGQHAKVIAEQKAMPKPNLPKSEFKKEELHTGLDIVADAKVKSKEKSAKELSAQVKAAAKGSDKSDKKD